MKKLLWLFIMLLIMITYDVFANEIYYENSNGVYMTKKEYDFYSEMYWDGYQQYVKNDEIEKLRSIKIYDEFIFKNTILNYNKKINTFSTSVNELMRTTTIAKVCSSECYVTLITNWSNIPQVKSYDVTGVRLSNSSFTLIEKASVSANNYYQEYSSYKSSGTGIGFSINVPNKDNIKVTVSFYTSKSGSVYGTYQHATSSISLNNSKLYNINSTGFGGVYSFYGAAFGKYDNASGVNISLI